MKKMIQRKLLRFALNIICRHGLVGANTINTIDEYIRELE